MDLSLSRNYFDLDRYFLKPRVLRASKRDLEREISTTVERNWIFFFLRVFEVQSKPLLSSHLSCFHETEMIAQATLINK